MSVEVEVTARIRAAWNRSPPDAATALREVPNVEERARLLARLWAGFNGAEATEEERHYKRVLLILARQPSSTYSTFVFIVHAAFPEEEARVWATLAAGDV